MGSDALRALAGEPARVARRRGWPAKMARDPSALLGGAVLLALVLAAIFAPRLAPYDAAGIKEMASLVRVGEVQALSPPFWDRRGDAPCDPCGVFEERYLPRDPRFVLGTDTFGRDMLSMLLYGTRFSLSVGLLAVALVAVIGTALGLAAGWLGGLWDYLAMRTADATEAVPSFLAYILFALVAVEPLAAAFASIGLSLDGVPAMALVLSCVGWIPVARLVRGQVLALKESEWVLAARATGVPGARIVIRHLLPHAVGPVLVAASAQLSAILIAEGLLGALGISQRTAEASVGGLIITQFRHTVEATDQILMPVAVLLAISLAVAALSDGLQRALDPEGGGYRKGGGARRRIGTAGKAR